MPTNKELGHNFGRQAGRYDRYAIVQRRLADQLIQTLAQQAENFTASWKSAAAPGILPDLAGVGSFPRAQITAVDLAPEVLQAAQARLGDAAGIDWLVTDGEHELPGTFDLITASSVFPPNGSKQPGRACRLYWEHLHPGGVLAFTSLRPEIFRELAASFPPRPGRDSRI